MANPSNGHVDWGNWSFDFDVVGVEGLVLRNGRFKGHRVFYKLSLPVMRVKYKKMRVPGPFAMVIECGPYNDQISRGSLVTFQGSAERFIRIIKTEHLLEIGVYARLGAYHIYQAWYIESGGVIRPKIWSRGLQCNADHWHHPYWRFDFDLDSPGNHRVLYFPGRDVVLYVNKEGSFTGTGQWAVQNLVTKSIVWISLPHPNPKEGITAPTSFSNLDVYVRKFRQWEDRPWPHHPTQDIHFPGAENPDGTDIVFWYVGHLFHHAAEGGDDWHGVGPTLRFEPNLRA